ncbi:hypothetical protein KBC55_04470 [Patescibacteria group bacterium]|nr:hypothetical protein [Patescibacteria group bacterium]
MENTSKNVTAAFTVGQIWKEGFALLKANALSIVMLIVGLGAVAFVVQMAAVVIMTVINLIFAAIRAPFLGLLFLPLIYVVLIGLQVLIQMVVMRFGLQVVDKKVIDWKALVKFDAKHVGLFFLAILITGFAIGLGYVFLIVPGIIAALFLMATPYIAVEKAVNPIDAMKASVELTEGSRLNIFLTTLSITLLPTILWVIPFMILLLGIIIDDNDFVPVMMILIVLSMIPIFIVTLVVSIFALVAFPLMYRKMTLQKPNVVAKIATV